MTTCPAIANQACNKLYPVQYIPVSHIYYVAACARHNNVSKYIRIVNKERSRCDTCFIVMSLSQGSATSKQQIHAPFLKCHFEVLNYSINPSLSV